MEKWAGSSLGSHVHFLMVCVDPDPERTAESFIATYGLKNTIVGYCQSRQDFPTFPAQLGCQGLVVFDSAGAIAVPCSPALNRVGVSAFKKVDAVIVTLAEDAGVDEDDLEPDSARPRVYGSAQELQEDLYNAAVAEQNRVRAATCAAASGKRPAEEACNVAPEERYKAAEAEARQGTGHQQQQQRRRKLGQVPSVGHAEMDLEHSRCALAFDRLQRERSTSALGDLIELLAAHFKHEEELMVASGFGAQAPAGLSPVVSHKTDHERILQAATEHFEEALDAAMESEDAVGPFVKEDCAAKISLLFETHAKEFDARYEGHLS
jgi:hemerythrin